MENQRERERINNVIMLFMDMCIIASLGYIVLKFPLQRDTDKLKVSTVPLHIYVCFCVFLLIQLVILRIEVNYLLEVELKQRGTIIIHQPQHVLEQNRIHIHENHPLLAPMIHNEILLLIILLHHLNQNPKGVFF